MVHDERPRGVDQREKTATEDEQKQLGKNETSEKKPGLAGTQ